MGESQSVTALRIYWIQPMIEKRILRRREVEQITGLSRASIYRLMSRGKFPKPIELDDVRAVVWVAAEVEAWVDSILATRERAP